MNQQELEQLKADIEAKVANLHAVIQNTSEDLYNKIDKIYEAELLKTLDTIKNRLSAIENRLDDMTADKKEEG